jgi:hypothetical protein
VARYERGELERGCNDDWTAADAAPWQDGTHLDLRRHGHPLRRDDYDSEAAYADALFSLGEWRREILAAETARAHLAAARQLVAICLDFGDPAAEGSNAYELARAFATIDSLLYGV